MQHLSSFNQQLTSESQENSSNQHSDNLEISSFNQYQFRSGSPDFITYPYPLCKTEEERLKAMALKPNQVGSVILYGVRIVSLVMDGKERLCLAQISNTLLKDYSYNEIHNRRVALGITCVQCTPVQLEILRRAGAMPISSRRCGMITKREAERLCKSFLGDNAPPKLPDNFAFEVHHECAWGCRGQFVPSRYNSSRAKCIKCLFCSVFFSPNKFVFHSHRIAESSKYIQPDAANFNSWRRHTKLYGDPPEVIVFAWEDIKAMFNGGSRKRMIGGSSASPPSSPFSGMTNTSDVMSGNESHTVDAVSPKPAKIRKSESRSHEKKPFQIGAPYSGHSPFNFGPPIRPIPPPTHQPSSGHGSSFLEPGFDSLPDPRNNNSNAFAPEKMAFAAAAAAVAAANSNNAKGLSDYLWSSPAAAMHPFPMSYPFFWNKRSMASLPNPLLFGESPLNCGLPKHPDFFRSSSDFKVEDIHQHSHATTGLLHWMEQRRRLAEEAFPNSLCDLSESVSHSLSSAFRPVMFKTYEREESSMVGKKLENQNCNSPETGCSEVSTTVDKDEPSGEDTDIKKFEEAIDLRKNDDVTEIEVEKKVLVKSQFKDFSVQKIVSGLSENCHRSSNE